jgi:hypothetical protein
MPGNQVGEVERFGERYCIVNLDNGDDFGLQTDMRQSLRAQWM